MADEKHDREQLAEKLDRELDEHLEAVMEKNKDYKYDSGITEDNMDEKFRQIPLFSKEPPSQEDIDESVPLQALQALKYENDNPHECALAHKEDGNYHFQKKDYKVAIKVYTEALKQKHEDSVLYAVLYTNKAAANFHLGNNRSALNDATSALKHKPDHIKAVVRCAICCFDLERYDDCVKWCDQGLQIDAKEKKLLELKKKCIHQKKQQERDKRKGEMKKVKNLAKRNNLLDAIEERNINIELPNTGGSRKTKIDRLLLNNTAAHSGKIRLDENNVLHWPIYFLYPEYNQSDFIEDFSENNCFGDYIPLVFETFPEWDADKKYAIENIEIFFEEDESRKKLIHLRPEITLRTALSDPRYALRGGCPAFMILSKDTNFYKETVSLQEVEEFN